ncbi:hypothetical protein [Dietzia sp. B32]|uniref:hypothetical protein n=1 Tax=Dietzia sp. B32 TaxID=2915130 RepID=UPI0021ADCC89|nr:hypothetical protein [Dietzia sp. B32]UVE94091.1 hypothetical protein L8M95_11050 [Dietzia sp. B32]
MRPQSVALLAVVASILLWCVGFSGSDPREMGELGLLSDFNTAIVAAIILLLGSTLVCIYQHRPGWVIGTHLVTYLALVHGTPAVLYDTARYSWTYKHVGVVEYILRTGAVDPGIDSNPIYHNWPGLFAASALVADLGGEGAADAVALWAPLGFNLILLVVLRYLFRGFTGRPAVVWLALVLYFTMTWVGQDYYSPQAAVYILYLGMIGLLIRNPRGSAMRTLVFSVLVAAMAVTHQITLVILLMAVAVLVATRQTRGWYLPVIAVAIVSAWALTFAGDYTIYNFRDLISGFGQPLSNADATFSKSDGAVGAQRWVVWGDRFTVAAGAAFALLGVWRTRREGTLHWAPVVLMLVPVAVLVQMSFGGESLLRVFLFSAPFIAFLAAEACAPRVGSGAFDQRRFTTAVLALVLIVPGFLLGYYGKERYNYFTDQEIAAAQWIATNAPAGSLLVEGDVNYPRQSHGYEKFTYVPIAFEPSVDRLLERPEDTLHQWLSNPRYTDGYVVITRSQKIGAEMYGSLPAGALTDLERDLAASYLFRVVHHSGDATVFTLSEFGRRVEAR